MEPHKKIIRYASAQIRTLESEERTPEEQIALLDARLGIGVGAVKERAKLIAKIRAEEANSRTPLDQLKILDERLGFRQGARKEREKLLDQLDYRALDCYKTWLRNHDI